MESTNIKVGDYIDGIEQWGNPEIPEYNVPSTLSSHVMRLVVKNIYFDKENNAFIYSGKADDSWHGARGGSVSSNLGKVRVITDEEPFTNAWWLDKENTGKVYKQLLNVSEEESSIEDNTDTKREWKAFDLVRHFKGTEYRIIGIGVDTETEKEVIMYKKADNTGNVWVRPRDMFESEVDHDKYPDVKQKYRFELVGNRR